MFKDKQAESMYEIASALHDVGVMDKDVFKEISDYCFVKDSVKPVRVKRETVTTMQAEAVM
jgi:hypothetical protein